MKLKLSISILFIIISLSAYTQTDWSKLSANQKIKLAKKEQKEAKKDPEYLQMMDEAMRLFQEGQYEKAKEKYAQAHLRRPDNVYPMVMLDDIEIAMNLPKEELVEEEVPVSEPEIEVILIEEPALEEDQNIENSEIKEEIIVEEKEINLPKDPEKTTPVVAKPERRSELKSPATQVQKSYENDGVYRESLKEGSAKVEQITIVEKGISTVYRRVDHSWGATYFFKNGEAITEKEWDNLMSELEKN